MRAGFPCPIRFRTARSNGRGSIGIVTVVVCFFATAVETTGHTLAVCRITGVPGEDWRIRGAVSNDGLGSIISALFGGMALTSYSQNIGVISLTGVGSRFVVAAGGAFLIVMAMIPKVGAIIALMPNAVLGGVLLFMFGMVASVGLDIIGRNMTSRRDALIVASSLALGWASRPRRRTRSTRFRRRSGSSSPTAS